MKLIPVYHKYKICRYLKIDDVDFDKLSKHRILTSPSGYPRLIINGKFYLVHRYILNPNENEQIDHVNHDLFDCRKINLRAVSNKENSENRDGPYRTNKLQLRGVRENKNGTFFAYVTHNYKQINCGTYVTAEEAEEAAKRKRIELQFKSKNLEIPNTQITLKALPIFKNQYRGVRFDKRSQKFIAYCKFKNKTRWGGCFTDIEEANRAAIKLRSDLGISK